MNAGAGTILIQLDGLSYGRARDGIARGLLPTLGRWLGEGRLNLYPLDSGLPSQTSSAQATLLLGADNPPPGFRWFDRAAWRARTSRSPGDLRHAARHWPGHTGLLRGGAAITAAWPADAARHALALSEGLRWPNLRDLAWPALRPHWPAGARGASLAAILRGALVVGALDALSAATAAKAIRGGCRPVFVTLLGYDQVAHHAGLDAPMTDWALRRLDVGLSAIASAVRDGDRIVVFADHGLSPCTPFRSLRGQTLRALIAGASATHGRDWHVAASGNLAHVYALSASATAALDRLIPALAAEDAIGFVADGGVARGREGQVDLATGAASPRNPLSAYGRPALRAVQLAGLARHPDAGDLIVMGAVNAGGGVVVFEDQRAAHGGLGGAQTEAFAALPAGCAPTRELDLPGLREAILTRLSSGWG